MNSDRERYRCARHIIKFCQDFQPASSELPLHSTLQTQTFGLTSLIAWKKLQDMASVQFKVETFRYHSLHRALAIIPRRYRGPRFIRSPDSASRSVLGESVPWLRPAHCIRSNNTLFLILLCALFPLNPVSGITPVYPWIRSDCLMLKEMVRQDRCLLWIILASAQGGIIQPRTGVRGR